MYFGIELHKGISPTSELKMKILTDKQIAEWSNKIKTETLLAYGVYHRSRCLQLFWRV